MVTRSETSWKRLLELTTWMEVVQENGGMDAEFATRLRHEVFVIIGRAGGVDLLNVDFKDAASGALAEHAFQVLARELITHPDHPDHWKKIVADIKADHPLPPPRSR